jgi:hypothetical protein
MTQKLQIVRSACACFNANGEPDLFYARFLLNQEDANPDSDDGYKPYDLIDKLAEREGYELVGWRITDVDPPSSILDLCSWHTIPLHDADLKQVDPLPWPNSIWYDARDRAFWKILVVEGDPNNFDEDPVVVAARLHHPEDGEDIHSVLMSGLDIKDLWSRIYPRFGHVIHLPKDAGEE